MAETPSLIGPGEAGNGRTPLSPKFYTHNKDYRIFGFMLSLYWHSYALLGLLKKCSNFGETLLSMLAGIMWEFAATWLCFEPPSNGSTVCRFCWPWD